MAAEVATLEVVIHLVAAEAEDSAPADGEIISRRERGKHRNIKGLSEYDLWSYVVAVTPQTFVQPSYDMNF